MKKLSKRKYQEYDLKRGIDFIGVTCVFFCHDGKGNLLLHKRSKNCRDEVGCWDVGGGSMEFGEEFEDAVRREIKEEYTCAPVTLTLVGPYNSIRINNGILTHWVALVFVAELNPNQVKIGEPEKMEELGWFTLDNLPSPTHSEFSNFFDHVKKYII